MFDVSGKRRVRLTPQLAQVELCIVAVRMIKTCSLNIVTVVVLPGTRTFLIRASILAVVTDPYMKLQSDENYRVRLRLRFKFFSKNNVTWCDLERQYVISHS